MFVLCAERLEAQDITLGIGQNRLGVPFLSSPLGDAFYPEIYLAYEIGKRSRAHIDYCARVVAKTGYHSSKSPYGTKLSVGMEILPRYQHARGFYVEAIAGVHYSHVFSNLSVYRAVSKSSGDSIAQSCDWGRPHLSWNFGISPGINLGDDLPVRVFARADMELHYAPSLSFGMLNILPATTLLAGVSFGGAR